MNEKSKVLALKYRPKIFEELIGQKIISDTIINSIKANKIPIIQNLVTTLDSGHPLSSKWWWIGAIKKNFLPTPYLFFVYLKYNTWMITDKVSITKTPPTINSKTSFFRRIANVPKAAPVDNEPTSPIKISAGLALNHKKPKQPPKKAVAKIVNSLAKGKYAIYK